MSPPGPGGFLSNCYHGEDRSPCNLRGIRVRFDDSPQRLRRRDLAGPRSSSSTSSPGTASSTSSSARSTGPTSWTSSDAQHEEFRELLAIARVRPERHRLADRQDQDHRAVRRAPAAVRPGPGPGRLLRDARGSGSSASTSPPATTRPRTGRGHAPDGRARPPRGRPRGHAAAREREGDLRRHRRRGFATSSRRSIRRPSATPSTRPITSRSASRSTRPGTCSASRVKHFHVKDYDAKTHRNVPAGEGDGQIPALLEQAAAAPATTASACSSRTWSSPSSRSASPAPSGSPTPPTALKGILDERAIAYA